MMKDWPIAMFLSLTFIFGSRSLPLGMAWFSSNIERQPDSSIVNIGNIGNTWMLFVDLL